MNTVAVPSLSTESYQQPLDRVFEIEIVFDDEAKLWVASCDDIGLATESESIQGVIDRANLIIPDLLECNGFPVKNARYMFDYAFSTQHTVTFN